MAMSDEVRAAPRNKPKSTEKKTFAQRFIPLKTDKPSEVLSKVIVLISILALIVCGIVLGLYFYHILEARHNNAVIKDQYNVFNKHTQTSVVPAEEEPVVTEVADNGSVTIVRKPLVKMEFAEKMLEINKDYVGYVSIPNVVDEAVVQAEDDKYYLKKNIYGQTRSCGTVFADYRNNVNDYADLQSDNIILYGHNNKDGTMFGELDYYYNNKRYWLQNPFIYFDNHYEHSTYVIIASFVTNVLPEHDNGNVFDYQNYINFDEKHSFDTFISEINARSHFHTGIDVNEDDKFITLSTCQYAWEPSRHVIIGRKLRPGETTDNIDTTNFELNSNPKWPAIYYKINGGSYIETTAQTQQTQQTQPAQQAQ